MLLSFFLWEVMRYTTFELLFKTGQGLIVYFNVIKFFFYKCKLVLFVMHYPNTVHNKLKPMPIYDWL